MADDSKVLLRLSPDTIAVYRALVVEGEFGSLSDAVRTVLDSYAEDRVAGGTEPVYEVQTVDITELSSDGRSFDDMVRAAAHRYIEDRANIGERFG